MLHTRLPSASFVPPPPWPSNSAFPTFLSTSKPWCVYFDIFDEHSEGNEKKEEEEEEEDMGVHVTSMSTVSKHATYKEAEIHLRGVLLHHLSVIMQANQTVNCQGVDVFDVSCLDKHLHKHFHATKLLHPDTIPIQTLQNIVQQCSKGNRIEQLFVWNIQYHHTEPATCLQKASSHTDNSKKQHTCTR